jgi:hypothetical protein
MTESLNFWTEGVGACLLALAIVFFSCRPCALVIFFVLLEILVQVHTIEQTSTCIFMSLKLLHFGI